MRSYPFIIVLTLCLLSAGASFAQSRGNRVSLSAGAFIPNGLDVTLSFEHELRGHNAYEVLLNSYLKWADCPSCGHVCPESFWTHYNTYSFGLAWKPCVLRRRNVTGNLRLGVSGGTNRDEKFITGLLVGYESSYALRSGWTVFWQVRSDVMLNGTDLLRPGIAIGFKFPVFNWQL